MEQNEGQAWEPPPPPEKITQAEKPEMSEIGTILNVFMEPGRTFEDLRKKPRFILGLVLISILASAMSFALYQKVGEAGIRRAVNEQLDRSPQTASMPADQRQGIVSFNLTLQKYMPIVVFVIVVVVPFVIVPVIAGAGILFVVACRAVVEVQIELLHRGLCVGRSLDLNDDGEVVAFGEGGVGDEHVALLLEGHAGRVAAVAAGHAHALLGDRDGFAVFAKRGDLHFAAFGDEELEMGFDCVEDATAIGTGFGVIVVMVVIMPLVFFVLVVLFFGLQCGCAEGEREHGRECREGFQCDVGFLFHGWFSVFWI